ncbi:ABC transporter permease [Streptomyces phaeochromogenes]|uniref:ABC transporter permease n=1 Tax=Streptomyces phaeochromogenes TaxID=1923 RepID=A0ABZ1HKF7_STRPH|nr:ABC transporter permease [Streptomyces phaeochromogenes]WSD17723.1 ABC transporter permease [Streptomyces phaeochromogenes]
MRAHRLLLTAALLTVVLTTAVLATLTAYSGAIGDAALRHSLLDTSQGAGREESAAATTLIVKADVPPQERADADKAVREGARRTFDGLPVTLRTLTRSGPYALPRSLQPAAERSGDPDLTHFAALDRTQVRMVSGRLPGAPGDDREIEVALPEAAARELTLKAGARLTLVDRFGGPKVRIRVTGVYRPARVTSPYWQLEDLRGRGVSRLDFTTYGPLLADPTVLAAATGSGQKEGSDRTGVTVSAGQTGWLASADFSTVTTGRIDALRDAARSGPRSLLKSPSLHGTTAVTTSLPEELDRVERSLLVSRSTLLIVALQLSLLAGYALLLVARLLSVERAGETRLLRARGATRGRVARLAALEALLLAVPAAVCGPLLAGPLTRLLAGQGALSRIGLRLDTSVTAGGVWAVAAGVALGCALAVTLPALTGGSGGGGRARALPAPVRAGADVGLLVIAAVAYWQLSSQNSGAVTDDRSGTLGIDPLLVSAPALALLAGTVLTLRLLPPVARLAERRAASGRGLPTALAGWQFSRRPMRGAGPVLLLVLAIAMGMLAIGQGASWDGSQDDQADFRAGTSVRVTGAGESGLGQAGTYSAVDGVSGTAPAVRTTLPLSGNRTATVLALDTADSGGEDGLLMRGDLAQEPVGRILAGLGPKGTASPGAVLPKGSTRLGLVLRIRAEAAPVKKSSDAADSGTEGSGTEGSGSDSEAFRSEMSADVAVTLEDRYGTPYRVPVGELPADGRAHQLTLDLAKAAEAPAGRAAEPLALTGMQLDMLQPTGRAERHLLSVEELTAAGADGAKQNIPLPASWLAKSRSNSSTADPEADSSPSAATVKSGKPLTVGYGTGYVPSDYAWEVASLTIRLRVERPDVPEVAAVATDGYLKAAGARTGQRVDVTFGGSAVPVRIVDHVRALPTTQDAGGGDPSGGALLVDLRSVNRVLEQRYGESIAPSEWWLRTEPGAAARVAAELRERPDVEPSQVVVRDEVAEQLRDDPFGAGPEAAFAAASLVAAALAAVGFAVSTAGSLQARSGEFALLRALGAPRRQLARLVAAEQGVLMALALVVGVALGAVLTRAVIPLIVLTSGASRPVPEVLVELPLGQVVFLLAAVVVAPLAVTAVLALRREDTAPSLRSMKSLNGQDGE